MTTAARSRTTVWIRTKLTGAASSSERNSQPTATSNARSGGKKEAWKRDNVRRVEALWRRKAWARSLPRHKLADAPHLARAAARRPSVGDGAQDLTAPAHRREQRRKKTQKMMSRTAPTNPAERAAQLRQELEQCDRFMRATDAVVRRTQERTLAISTLIGRGGSRRLLCCSNSRAPAEGRREKKGRRC